MDEKFTKRYESFKNSLSSLSEARERDMTDSFVLSGTSAKFSITFDLAWKVMKDILVQYYAITGFVAGSPREVLRESFQANLIEGWHHRKKQLPDNRRRLYNQIRRISGESRELVLRK